MPKAKKKYIVKRKRKYKPRKKAKENYGGISAEVKIDDDLKKIVRVDKCTRAYIVKKIWNYIKRHKLQDPVDGRFFYPDEKLSKLIGPGENLKENAFQMNRWVKHHIIKTCSGDTEDDESEDDEEGEDQD